MIRIQEVDFEVNRVVGEPGLPLHLWTKSKEMSDQ